MSLERIIRPFEASEVFTARVLAPATQPASAPEPDVELLWGDGNSGDYSQFQLSGLVGGVVTFEEKSRVTRTVRVTNPDDDSQFVDVERIEKLVLASNRGDEIHFNLNNPA